MKVERKILKSLSFDKYFIVYNIFFIALLLVYGTII
jgi:hypothetical protein